MRRVSTILILALPLISGGCLSGPKSTAAAGKGPATSTSRPALPPQALLRLDELPPLPPLPASKPATRPSAAVPLEAIQLFAQARAAMEAGQRFTAVQLLEQTLAIDPDSFEVNLSIGQAATGTSLAARAIPALQRAAEINPDNAGVYIEMARLYVQQRKGDDAIKALRTARQTSEYRADAEVVLTVDYLLARTLQMGGYDTAALQQYEILLERVSRGRGLYRGPIEVMQVLRSPDFIFSEVSSLSAKLGDIHSAIIAIEQAMLEAPDNQQYAITRVRLLEQANRGEDARQFMPRVISRFGANVETMNLLRELYQKAGGEPAATAALQRAFSENNADANIGFALADLLQRNGDADAAKRILQQLAVSLGYRQDVVTRLFDFNEAQGRTLDAAQVLIESSALHPEELSEQAIKMSRLTRLSRSNHLRLADLQNLQLQSWAEAARLYWVARLGELWDRDELARAALEKSVRIGKPYPPAYRLLTAHYWARRDWDIPRKLQSSRDLMTLAGINGNNELAAELRGIIALHQNNLTEAADALLESMRGDSAAPDVLLTYAAVQQKRGKATDAERILLKITDDYPQFEQAYSVLISFYMQRGSPASALKTLQKWLTADPRNPSARLIQGTIFVLTGRRDAGEKILLDLFDDYADNADVLLALQQLYMQSNRLDTFVKLLEQKRQGRPDIREIAERLVDIYAQQQRMSEAVRVLEDLRRSAAGDGDLLYYLSHLYLRIEDPKTAESILEEVIKSDPNHSSAANDLGYYMAEQNRDLDRAQQLVSLAVTEEPDNQAFLDSMGWVLYKRAEFAEAVGYLERAIAQTVNPDPVVLDHLGDAYYRSGRVGDAAKRWIESNKSLPEAVQLRLDLQSLKLQLQNKLRQNQQNLPVQVAPTAQEANSGK